MEKTAQAKLGKKKLTGDQWQKNYDYRPNPGRLHRILVLVGSIPDAREPDEHSASDVRCMHHVLRHDDHHHQWWC